MKDLNYNSLTDIDDVAGINDKDDKACLDELAKVVKKYGLEGKFGINLLHSHFEMAEDEILVEDAVSEKDDYYIKPYKKSELIDRGLKIEPSVIKFN